MNEVKVGSCVVCKDNDNMQKFLTVGKQYEVKGLNDGYLHVVQDNGIVGKVFTYRFKLAKEPVTNGVDAEGKAIFFDLTDLKSWQRVVTENGAEWIVSEKDGEPFLITLNAVEDMKGPNWVSVNAGFEWDAVEVYGEPKFECDMMSVEKRGNLIWKRKSPKTSEQLAQEAAVAARNKAIEEAEKALNVAQQKLNELKGL